jgi:hypothetical protein
MDAFRSKDDDVLDLSLFLDRVVKYRHCYLCLSVQVRYVKGLDVSDGEVLEATRRFEELKQRPGKGGMMPKVLAIVFLIAL